MFILKRFWWLPVILFLSTGLEGRAINQDVVTQSIRNCELKDTGVSDNVDGWVGCSIDKIEFDKNRLTLKQKVEPTKVSLMKFLSYTLSGVVIFLLM
ncbi:MAG: hypothetical protein QMD71_03370 [bacterium]|nr:hypothetical protein [bacterium]